MEKETKTKSPHEEMSRLKKVATIGALSLALAIIIIDSTVLNVSFSYLVRDLNTDVKGLQWVITIYSLMLAAFTITGGRFGDLFGRKRMFVLGAIIFAIGSFIASESHSVRSMIIGESVIEGIGAALMMPATASILVSTFQGRARAMAMGIWGGIAAAASAIGPIVGGYLTTNYSWRWAFRINIFVAALLVLGSFIIKEYRDKEEKPTLDWLGMLLSSTGLFALVFGVIESSTYGWVIAKEVFSAAGRSIDLGDYSIVLPSLIIGVILLILFGFWENRVEKMGKTPIVSMKIFSNQQFSSAVLTITILALGQSGLIFTAPIFFQGVRHLDALHTGYAFLPNSIAALITAPLAASLSRKVSPKRIIQFGIACSVIAMYLFRRALSPEATVSDFYPAMIVFGIGMGSVMAQISNMIMSSVSVEQAGEVSGLNNTMRQIGMSLGAAIIGATMLSALSSNLINGINESQVISEKAKPFITAAIEKDPSNFEFSGQSQMPANASKASIAEMTRIVNESITNSNKDALFYTQFIILFALLVSTLLPDRKNLEQSQSLAKR